MISNSSSENHFNGSNANASLDLNYPNASTHVVNTKPFSSRSNQISHPYQQQPPIITPAKHEFMQQTSSLNQKEKQQNTSYNNSH